MINIDELINRLQSSQTKNIKCPRFSEETLTNWTKPPSNTEETKLSNSERMVREAIQNDPILSSKNIEIFGQGSYANDTNVRLNSDIDINVKYGDAFYYDLPKDSKKEDFGLGTPSTYSLQAYKDDVENALIKKFGRNAVVRKNKCITILESSTRVETDVVPTFNYRLYDKNGGHVLGTKLRADDDGTHVRNFPKQHIENGKTKNSQTSKRFKKLTRVFRKIRYKMIDDNVPMSDSITSFLLECLIWNVPNSIINDHNTWQERLEASILHLYHQTSSDDKCKEWGEVSELLYLFHGERKWNRKDVNEFLVSAWNYLGYE